MAASEKPCPACNLQQKRPFSHSQKQTNNPELTQWRDSEGLLSKERLINDLSPMESSSTALQKAFFLQGKRTSLAIGGEFVVLLLGVVVSMRENVINITKNDNAVICKRIGDLVDGLLLYLEAAERALH